MTSDYYVSVRMDLTSCSLRLLNQMAGFSQGCERVLFAEVILQRFDVAECFLIWCTGDVPNQFQENRGFTKLVVNP